MSADRTIEDYRELARLNHSGTHSCSGVCLAVVVAAFDAERDALAAVAEAPLDEKVRWAVVWLHDLIRDGRIEDLDPNDEYVTWANAAYDRTVAKP